MTFHNVQTGKATYVALPCKWRDVLVAVGAAPSKTAADRLIKQGAVNFASYRIAG